MHILFVILVYVQSLFLAQNGFKAQRCSPLCDYLEGHFLEEQVESINKLAKHHANSVRAVGDGLRVPLRQGTALATFETLRDEWPNNMNFNRLVEYKSLNITVTFQKL